MIIIAVINEKGGVAKTTTAVNLAHGLARKNYRVLLADLDPQSNATAACGLNWREYEGRNVGEGLLTEDPFFDPYIVDLNHAGISILPATRGLRDVAHELAAQGNPIERVSDGLSKLENEYDFAILDLPPTLEILQEMAIEAADRFIIPLELSAFAIDGFTELIRHLAGRKRGAREWQFRILLSKVEGFNPQTNIASLADLGPLSEYLLSTVIRFNGKIPMSQREGQDIFTYAPQSRGARDFRKLIREIEELWPAQMLQTK